MEEKEQVDKECAQMKRGEVEEKGKRGKERKSVINVVDCSALSNLSNKLLSWMSTSQCHIFQGDAYSFLTTTHSSSTVQQPPGAPLEEPTEY